MKKQKKKEGLDFKFNPAIIVFKVSRFFFFSLLSSQSLDGAAVVVDSESVFFLFLFDD